MIPTQPRATGVLLLLVFAALYHGIDASKPGEPHSTVITLTSKNFDEYLADPANGLWFLKFYAPWCGHCKKMAPVLDKVAPFLSGKMAVGKIDCTKEKSLCKKFDIKGYPTLKYYRDGDFNDYPLARDADSIILFGEKMSDRAVQIVSSYSEAKEKLIGKIPVAFVVYDPETSSSGVSAIDASGATDAEKESEKMIQSTERTRAFGQVARKMQADGSFGLLSPNISRDEIAKFFDGDAAKVPSGGFIARIEEDVPVKLFEGEISTQSVTNFTKENNLPIVIDLGGHNFRFVGRKGKPLAVGVYNPDDEAKTNKFRQELKKYATTGAHKDDYIFSTMDGKKWDKFVGQFSITKESMPELFVLDVPERTYWQDSSVFGVSDFIKAVKNGEIESREQEKIKKSGFEEFLDMFVKYMPWSLFAMLTLFAVAFCMFLPSMEDSMVRPPPPPMPKNKVQSSEQKLGENGSDSKKEK